MEPQETPKTTQKELTKATEGATREQLATYFLSVPPWKEQTAAQRREYIRRLRQLGTLEQQELIDHVGAPRPMVWTNPSPLIQAVCGAAQRLGATCGVTLRTFPAVGIALGQETLVNPRMLTVTLCALLRDLCQHADGQTIWVKLQEKQCGLAVTATIPREGLSPTTIALIKECTRLHEVSLVHSDHTILFTCGQTQKPAAGVRLYAVPSERELLNDSLSPVWSVFYADLYQSSLSNSTVSKSPASTMPG